MTTPKFKIDDVVQILVDWPPYEKYTLARVTSVDPANGRYEVEFLDDADAPTEDFADFGEIFLAWG